MHASEFAFAYFSLLELQSVLKGLQLDERNGHLISLKVIGRLGILSNVML